MEMTLIYLIIGWLIGLHVANWREERRMRKVKIRPEIICEHFRIIYLDITLEEDMSKYEGIDRATYPKCKAETAENFTWYSRLWQWLKKILPRPLTRR